MEGRRFEQGQVVKVKEEKDKKDLCYGIME